MKNIRSVILPPDFLNQLRMQVRVSDIVRKKVMLTKKGNEFQGLCPFHNEKTPSFTVNDTKRFYHCFGCGAHGDAIKFESEITGLSYKESAILIAKDAGIEIPKIDKKKQQEYEEEDYLLGLVKQAHEFYRASLDSRARNYLNERGISDEHIDKFELGYSPGRGKLYEFFQKKSIKTEFLLKAGLVKRKDSGRIYELFNDRVMFPIRNIYNKIVGFGGRVLDDSLPKYINSPETSFFKKNEIMYGENLAASKAHIKNYSILVEGYMDVIALQSRGYGEAVASLGTAVSEKHLQKLWRFGKEIICCLDGDAAGIRASKKLIDMSLPIVGPEKEISFITLPNKSDPDDFIKSHGKDEFDRILEKRNALSKQIWLNEAEHVVFGSAEDRAALEQKLFQYANSMEHQALAKSFRNFFKEMLWQKVRKNFSGKSKKFDNLPQNIPVAKEYKEAEVIEKSILSLLLRYPALLKNIDITEEFENIIFFDQKLSEFKYWLMDIYSQDSAHEQHDINTKAKNSRFYQTYSLLSEPEEMFLEVDFIDKNIDNVSQVFHLLSKKHFLLQLTKEYSDIAKIGDESSDTKSAYYISEIQKTTEEIRNITSSFIN